MAPILVLDSEHVDGGAHIATTWVLGVGLRDGLVRLELIIVVCTTLVDFQGYMSVRPRSVRDVSRDLLCGSLHISSQPYCRSGAKAKFASDLIAGSDCLANLHRIEKASLKVHESLFFEYDALVDYREIAGGKVQRCEFGGCKPWHGALQPLSDDGHGAVVCRRTRIYIGLLEVRTGVVDAQQRDICGSSSGLGAVAKRRCSIK